MTSEKDRKNPESFEPKPGAGFDFIKKETGFDMDLSAVDTEPVVYENLLASLRAFSEDYFDQKTQDELEQILVQGDVLLGDINLGEVDENKIEKFKKDLDEFFADFEMKEEDVVENETSEVNTAEAVKKTESGSNIEGKIARPDDSRTLENVARKEFYDWYDGLSAKDKEYFDKYFLNELQEILQKFQSDSKKGDIKKEFDETLEVWREEMRGSVGNDKKTAEEEDKSKKQIEKKLEKIREEIKKIEAEMAEIDDEIAQDPDNKQLELSLHKKRKQFTEKRKQEARVLAKIENSDSSLKVVIGSDSANEKRSPETPIERRDKEIEKVIAEIAKDIIVVTKLKKYISFLSDDRLSKFASFSALVRTVRVDLKKANPNMKFPSDIEMEKIILDYFDLHDRWNKQKPSLKNREKVQEKTEKDVVEIFTKLQKSIEGIVEKYLVEYAKKTDTKKEDIAPGSEDNFQESFFGVISNVMSENFDIMDSDRDSVAKVLQKFFDFVNENYVKTKKLHEIVLIKIKKYAKNSWQVNLEY